MSDHDDDGKKWSCVYCTYENWPSAVKCTLCRGPKPTQLIAEEASRQEERDIYNLAPLISTSDNGNGIQNLINRDTGNPFNKWLCPTCTYMNWPRATKCAQCLTQRKRSSPTSITTLSHDHLQPLHVSVNSDAIGGIANSNSIAQRGSPKSPDMTKETKDMQNGQNRVYAIAQQKWTCVACTYKNWPKSLKCVLCMTPRGKTSPDEKVLTLDQDERCSTSPEDNRICAPSSTAASSSGSPNKQVQSCIKRTSGSQKRCPSSSPENEVAALVPSIAGASASTNNYEQEQRLKQLRKCMREADWPWLNACLGVVDGDPIPVENYLGTGGDASRQLTESEATLLGRPSAFDVGHTLVHLAIRFQREDLLRLLLSSDVACGACKKVPSHVSPDLAADIRRYIAASLLQRKGDFPCFFVTELVTFALPAEIEDLPTSVQEQLYDELLDRDVQKELEVDAPIINWSLELTERLGSRLYPLWNRTAGDCLLDSVLQATWGVFDKENALRRALSDSLNEAAATFYPRWKESEAMQANLLHFTLDEAQWQQDWAILLSLASQPGASLEQLHVFGLAHILRRPIIVYGVKYVKSFRGEAIGYARFEGVYLPLLWDRGFCWKSPLALGYTRGHFSALVPMEPDTSDNLGAGANIHTSEDLQVTFLPLMTSDCKILPVHFLTSHEIGHEEHILRQWMDCCITPEGGILVAQQKIQKRPLLVAQLVEEWLNHYRRMSHIPPPTLRSPTSLSAVYSSDGDSDDE